MREILFRGKTAYGDWIEGRYVKVSPVDFPENRRKTKSVIFPTNAEVNWFDKYFYKAKEVIPETVGQFTGLQDDNGKRIFEGDIVDGLILHNLPIRAVVAFQEGAFGLDWQRGEVRVFTAFTSYCNTVFKVIGNIHDNPDLLKGGSDDE